MKLLPLFLLILSAPFTNAQEAFPFNDAALHNTRISLLDSTYKSAIHSDPTLAVFQNQEEVVTAYQSLLQDFGSFLAENNFRWEQNTTSFNRIYFDADGSIDYFLYQFRGTQLSEEKQARFNDLLNQFIQTYRFPLTANLKFAQCSPVTYTPQKED